jgi:hypothetical protein
VDYYGELEVYDASDDLPVVVATIKPLRIKPNVSNA